MNLDTLISALKNTLGSKNTGSKIERLQTILNEKLDEAIQCESFFSLPLEFIQTILCKIDFSDYPNYFNLMANIIKFTNKFHPKRGCCILNSLCCKSCDMPLQQYIGLIRLFTNSDICREIGPLYDSFLTLPIVDYDSDELQAKTEENEKLKMQIQTLSQVIHSPKRFLHRPEDYEADLETAVVEGKLSSVIYTIEAMNESPHLDCGYGSLLHRACEFGHLSIVEYLIDHVKLDTESRDLLGCTPLHVACQHDHIHIIRYLIDKKHVNIEAVNKLGNTPLHIAAIYGKIRVVEFLISKGVSKTCQNKHGQVPAEVTFHEDIQNLLK